MVLWLCGWLLGLATSLQGAEETFRLQGVEVALEEVTADVAVYYRSMRLNRAAGVWNFEAVVTNRSARGLAAPFLVRVESTRGTSGPAAPDGWHEEAVRKPYWDLSGHLANRALAPGEASQPRTLALAADGGGAPALVTRVFAHPVRPVALAQAQSLDETGQPLPGVEIVETGPSGTTTQRVDAVLGRATLGGSAGAYVWQFRAPGRLSVWRMQTLALGEVQGVASPWLTARSTNTAEATPLAGTRLTSVDRLLSLEIPAGAFADPKSVTLTPLGPQTLPAFLPPGWSPLQAFWLESDGVPSLPLLLTAYPWGAVGNTEAAALVEWDPAATAWRVQQVLPGDGTNAVVIPVSGGGIYAVVVPDAPPTAPAAVQPGQVLPGVSLAGVDFSALLAQGRVQPASRPASTAVAEVVATAELAITNRQGSLPSGLVLRGRVREAYDLRDGTRRFPPQFETSVVAYQRPGDMAASSLHARFPVRPGLIFGSEALGSGAIAMDILTPGPVKAGVVEPGGGEVTAEGMYLLAGRETFDRTQVVQLRRLDPTNYLELVSGGGLSLERAFELALAAPRAGHELVPQFDDLAPSASFVLGRVLVRDGVYGIEAVGRYRTGAEGGLASLEPATGDRLPGLVGSGQYLLLRVAAPLGLVTGVARDARGQPAAGLVARQGPWASVTGPGGVFRLVSPVGTHPVWLHDLDTGDDGFGAASVVDVQQPVALALATTASGPRVISVSPTNGATGVAWVTPVAIEFSEPIRPGSAGAAAIRLLDTNGQPVVASLALSLAGTVATVLPAEPLAAAARYTVQVSTNLTDFGGAVLEGPTQFSFTTAAEAGRRAGARLTIHEAVGGWIPVVGSPGTAEPAAPVILVNETSGRTATVLSKPDGSFTNVIEGEVDDVVSAVLVNLDGSRLVVPTSRQIFRDGSVGLFAGGGEVEAATPLGSMQVVVDPGAIQQRVRFQLEALGAAQVLALSSNTPPERSHVVGGFSLTMQGEDLGTPAHVSFPVDPATLPLPPGTSPTNQVFVLARSTEVDGVPVYELVESMRYDAGRLVTASPPWPGLVNTVGGHALWAIIMMPAEIPARLIVVGAVLLAPSSLAGPSASAYLLATNPAVSRVAGAVVTAYPSALAASGRGPGLQPGAFVARANSQGFYCLTVPYNAFEAEGIAVVARSPRLPGVFGLKGVGVERFSAVIVADVVIPRPEGPGGSPDTTAPDIAADPPSATLPVDQGVDVPLILRDDFSRPSVVSVVFDPSRSVATQTGQALSPASVYPPSVGTPVETSPVSVRVPVRLRVIESALACFRVKARDEAGNERETLVPLRFGPDPGAAPGGIPPSDPNDAVSPRVVSVTPGREATVQLDEVFVVRFSEAVRLSLAAGVGVDLSGGASVRVDLSADQRTATVWPIGLSAGTDYTLTFDSRVVDLVGNRLDQDQSTSALEPFTLDFRTPPQRRVTLPQVQQPAGTVVWGNYAFTLDRNLNALQGGLVVHHLAPSGVSTYRAALPAFPRAMALVPEYSFRRRPGAPVETNKPLLVVVGGLIGGGGAGAGLALGQWIRVVDLSDPRSPQRLVSTYLTTDPTAAASLVKVSGPRIAVYLSTVEGGIIQYLNLQGLILGDNYLPADWQAAGSANRFVPGTDQNGDGDYVDAGDLLPRPQRNDVYGLETVIPLAPGTDLLDLDLAAAGSLLVGTTLPGATGPSRLQVIFYNGDYIGSGETDDPGQVSFDPHRAFRVTLDLDFPVVDPGGVRRLPVALVAAGGKVHIVKLTDPMAPEILRSIPVADSAGTIFGIVRSGFDEYTVGASGGFYVFRRSQLSLDPGRGPPHPSFIQRVPLGMSGRALGATPNYFATSGGGVQAVFRPPRLSFLQVPTLPVTGATALIQQGETRIREFLERRESAAFLLPALMSAVSPDCPSGIDPPNPSFHHYALVEAPGDFGASLKLSVESLDLAGRGQSPKGPRFPAILLTDHASSLELSLAQPAVTALEARRLSDDPMSALYNLYLADPIVLVREPLSRVEQDQVAAVPGRQALWSGYYARVSFDAYQGGAVLDFQSRIAGREFEAGLSRTYPTLPGEYLDTPNPSLAASPVVAGVNLQSGEFRHRVNDLFVAGRHQDLLFTRIYESRSRYSGPLGRGWDFNWNLRLLEVPLDLPLGLCLTYYGNPALDVVANAGDVLLIDGNGTVRWFRRLPATGPIAPYASDPAIQAFGWNNRIDGYYQSPPGEFSVLYKFLDGTWVIVSPSGGRTYFSAAGQLDRVVGVSEASQLRCTYRSDGRLDRVIGDRGHEFEIGYYISDAMAAVARPQDRRYTKRVEVGLISRVRISGPPGILGEVSFTYDTEGNLERVVDPAGSTYRYQYDPNSPHQLTSLGCEGRGYPAQSIHYAAGLVESVTQDGQTTRFGGALNTAYDRYHTPTAVVTAQADNNPAARYTVDARGRPTRFAQLSQQTDDDGRMVRVADAQTTAELTYDVSNPVHRFRGNLLATTQLGRGSFRTGFAYDQSAWNRIVSRTNTEGVVTTTRYVGPGTAVTTVEETTGPVKRVQTLDPYGQMQEERLEEAGHTLIRQSLYEDYLPAGLRYGAGREARLVHSPAGFRAVSLGAGLAYEVAHNSEGQPTTLTSTAGDLPNVTMGYHQSQVSQETITVPGGRAQHGYTYDPVETTRVRSVQSQETGLPDSQTIFTYDGQGRLDSFTTSGELTDLTYAGVLLTRMRSPGSSREVVYSGNLPVRVIEQGVVTRIQYDAEERAEEVSYQGLTNRYSFNLGEQVASKTLVDAGGVLLDEGYTYDRAGRIQRATAVDADREFEYFADGAIRRMRINGQLVREVERDTAGRITRLRMPGLLEVHYSDFDPLSDQPRREEQRLFPSSGLGVGYVSVPRTFSYSPSGRVRTLNLGGTEWRFGYDGFGYLTEKTDPDGVRQKFTYSPGGRMLQVTFTDGTTADYQYDASQRLERVGAMGFELDPTEKLLAAIHYPDGTVTRYLDRNQFFEPDKIDQNGRIQRLTWVEGRVERFDGGDRLDLAYDGLGRRTRVALNGVATTFGYDARGQLEKEQTTPIAPATEPSTWAATFTPMNHLATETYPSGFSIDWAPAANGQPAAGTDAGITALEWQGPGLLGAVVYAGGLRAVHRYNPVLQKTAVQYETGPSTNPVPVAGFTYRLTSAGRVLAEERIHEGRVDVYERNGPLQGMRVVNFHLSATNATNGLGAAVRVEGLSFDGNGEMSGPTSTAGSDDRAVMPSLTFNQQRVVKADGEDVFYNLQGEVSQTPVWVHRPGQLDLTRETAQLTYDDLGMLRRVLRGSGPDQVTVQYTRDGMGRVVRREVSGPASRCRPGVTHYAWRGTQLIEESMVEGGVVQLVRRYVHLGPYLVAVQAAAGAGAPLEDYVPLVNLNGSVCGYATPSGVVREWILYGPYGAAVVVTLTPEGPVRMERSAVANTLRFQGAWFDEETGLYQMGQRNLHPQLGRFLQRDSRLYAASRALFTAFNGDPAGQVDPLGALPQPVEAAKTAYKNLKGFGDKSTALVEAINATGGDRLRKDTALGSAGMEWLSSGLTLASSFLGEDFKDVAESATERMDTVQLGLGILQAGLDMRRDKLILRSIKAHALAPEHLSARMKWLAVGGAAADYQLLDGNFYAEEAVRGSREHVGGSQAALDFYNDHRKDYAKQREGNLLAIGQGLGKLAGVYLAQALKDDPSRGAEVSQELLKACTTTLDLCELFRKVRDDKDIAQMAFSLSGGTLKTTAANLFQTRAHVQAAFTAGFGLGKSLVILLSDEAAAKAYKESAQQFDDNGGFVTVFAGLLTCANNDACDKLAFYLQRYADFSLAGYLDETMVRPYLKLLQERSREIEFYQRGLDAP